MTVELRFNRFGEWAAARRARPAAERAARDALAEREAAGGEAPAEVSFTCLPADEIAAMNRRYLDRDRPTDVIAFPLSGPDEPLVGDVYLCPEVAVASAEERGLSAVEEVVRLVAHGALHVLGHEHPEGEERRDSPMYRRQEEIVRRALEGGGSGRRDDGRTGGAPPGEGAYGGGDGAA